MCVLRETDRQRDKEKRCRGRSYSGGEEMVVGGVVGADVGVEKKKKKNSF